MLIIGNLSLVLEKRRKLTDRNRKPIIEPPSCVRKGPDDCFTHYLSFAPSKWESKIRSKQLLRITWSWVASQIIELEKKTTSVLCNMHVVIDSVIRPHLTLKKNIFSILFSSNNHLYTVYTLISLLRTFLNK